MGGNSSRLARAAAAVAGAALSVVGLASPALAWQSSSEALLANPSSAKSAAQSVPLLPAFELSAVTTSVQIAPLISERFVGHQGKILHTGSFIGTYSSGAVMLSGSPAPTGSFSVDDELSLIVTHQDGTTATYVHN